MPAHIRGCDAKSARSVDQGRPIRKTSVGTLTPAREDSQPKSQPLRNSTCLPSGRGRVNVESRAARKPATDGFG